MTDEVRDRLALALDVGGLDVAERLARRLTPWFGVAKVGMELYAEAGATAYEPLIGMGFDIFADLKLYDIPNTVERAARVHGRRGVRFLNFAAAAGPDVLRAGVNGLREGARDAGHPDPVALAVTVLTSEPDTSAFDERLDAAVNAGCDGVVCSAHEVTRVMARAPGFTTMVPGIRMEGGDVQDQARVATPREAFAMGATWLVIGRAVTASDDPEGAAAELIRSVGDGVELLRPS
jgi:orotidine-5'-phosphate decarboxylase